MRHPQSTEAVVIRELCDLLRELGEQSSDTFKLEYARMCARTALRAMGEEVPE